jgi:hypothetical protein
MFLQMIRYTQIGYNDQNIDDEPTRNLKIKEMNSSPNPKSDTEESDEEEEEKKLAKSRNSKFVRMRERMEARELRRQKERDGQCVEYFAVLVAIGSFALGVSTYLNSLFGDS